MNWSTLRYRIKIFKQKFGFQAFRERFLESQGDVLSVDNKNKLNVQPKIDTQIQIKKHEYLLLNQYFLSFCNSKSIAGRVNGQHLNFVTGSKSFGKTHFIEQNLKQFIHIKQKLKNPQNRKSDESIYFDKIKTPEFRQDQIRRRIFENQHYIVLKFNFQRKGNKNTDCFFHDFHEQIIKSIISCSQKLNQDKSKILCRNIIRQIVLSKKAPQYLHLYIRKTILNILEDKDPILLNDISKQALFLFNQKTKNLGTFHFLYEKWQQLIEIFVKQLRFSEVQATIRILLSAMKQIQYQYRPKQFFKTHYYQSGIQTTQFLFQILNFLCGVGTLNKNIVQRYFQEQKPERLTEIDKQLQQSQLDSVQRCYFQSRKVIDQMMAKQQNFILNGNHIDVVMAFMNFENLQCFNTSKFQNFFDHLIIALNNESNMRTHFPVLIQLDNPILLKNIQNTGMMWLQNPSIIDIPGYIQYLIDSSNIRRVFDEKVIEKLFPIFGRNPSTWNTGIKLLSQGVPIQDIILGKHQIYKIQKAKLEAKLNHIYCLPQCIQEVDNGTLKFEMLLGISFLLKVKGFFDCSLPYYDITVFDRPVYQGMKKMGIVYQHYYYSYSGLVNMMHLGIMRQIFKRQRRRNYLKWMMWKWFKKGGIMIKKKQAKFVKGWENQVFNIGRFSKDRSDFFVRYYYGPGDDYYKIIKKYKIDPQINVSSH